MYKHNQNINEREELTHRIVNIVSTVNAKTITRWKWLQDLIIKSYKTC